MAYYIVYFDTDNRVIDFVKYSESERESYLDQIELAIKCQRKIQYGYF